MLAIDRLFMRMPSPYIWGQPPEFPKSPFFVLFLRHIIWMDELSCQHKAHFLYDIIQRNVTLFQVAFRGLIVRFRSVGLQTP
jgi:hypothetical protein